VKNLRYLKHKPYGAVRELVGELPDCTDDLLRAVLDFHDHRAGFGCQGQALLGLLAAVAHQAHRIGNVFAARLQLRHRVSQLLQEVGIRPFHPAFIGVAGVF